MKKIMTVLFFIIASNTWAYGEIFLLTTKGTQYCSGFEPLRLNSTNSRRMYARFDDETSVSIFVDSLKVTPDYIANLEEAFIKSNALSFDVFYYEDDENHLEAIGTFKLDKFGFADKIKATFMRKGLLDDCYSVGKLTGKRIN